MKYYILGSNGFIGSNLYFAFEKNGLNVIALDRNNFDITKKDDYKRIDFSNSTIIDTIASIDDSEDEIFKVNVNGLKNFINYLKNNCKNYRYVYFSTASVSDKEMICNNHYVKSKHEAEKLIRKNILNYQIVRLVFPFGRGEKKTRLISRLIEQIRKGEQLAFSEVTLNLTPIEYITTNISMLLKSEQKEIILTDGSIYKLKEIVDFLYAAMQLPKNYTYDREKIVKHVFVSNVRGFAPIKKNIDFYLRKMLDENE